MHEYIHVFLASHPICLLHVTFSSILNSKNFNLSSNKLSIKCSKISMFMAIILSVVLLIAGVGGLILIHICVVGRAFTTGYPNDVVLRFNVPSELIISRRATGMAKGDIEKLPCFDFTLESSVSLMECAVCLESFKIGDKCRLLPPCNHNFHAKCVDYWLSNTPVCPICRSSVTYPWKVEGVVDVREVELESGFRNVISG